MKLKKEKIVSEKDAIASLLKTTRHEKKLKLKKIAIALNINIKYLRALEAGKLQRLPEGVYGKNYLKEYAIHLGLDHIELSKLFDEDKKNSLSKERSDIFSKQIIKGRSFLIMPKIIKNFLIAAVILICFLYLGVYINRIVSPPKIEIYEPIDNYIINNNYLNVIGISEKETQITINGELILLEEDGQFVKRIDLKSGVNTIIIRAKKKYSKEIIIRKQVVFENE